MVTLIIGLNVAMYIISLMVSGGGIKTGFSLFSFLSPSNRSLFFLGASGTIPINEYGRFWSVVSANWLHGGLMHIVFNMMAVRNLAPFILREFGTYRLIVIYVVGGVFAYIASYLAGVSFTIGASGAVCALVGATLYFGRSRGGVYGNAIYRQVMGWVVTMGVLGFLIPGINNWAHGAGLAAGVGIAWGLGFLERKRENQTDKSLAFFSVLLTVGALVWAVGLTAWLALQGVI